MLVSMRFELCKCKHPTVASLQIASSSLRTSVISEVFPALSFLRVTMTSVSQSKASFSPAPFRASTCFMA